MLAFRWLEVVPRMFGLENVRVSVDDGGHCAPCSLSNDSFAGWPASASPKQYRHFPPGANRFIVLHAIVHFNSRRQPARARTEALGRQRHVLADTRQARQSCGELGTIT